MTDDSSNFPIAFGLVGWTLTSDATLYSMSCQSAKSRVQPLPEFCACPMSIQAIFFTQTDEDDFFLGH